MISGLQSYAKRSQPPKPIDEKCARVTFFSCPGASYLYPWRSNREGQAMQREVAVLQKGIASHRAVKAITKRHVEGASASRPMEGLAMDLRGHMARRWGWKWGEWMCRRCRPAAMGIPAKERAVENRGTCSLGIPAWLRCLPSLSAKVAKVKMRGTIFSFLLPVIVVNY